MSGTGSIGGSPRATTNLRPTIWPSSIRRGWERRVPSLVIVIDDSLFYEIGDWQADALLGGLRLCCELRQCGAQGRRPHRLAQILDGACGGALPPSARPVRGGGGR